MPYYCNNKSENISEPFAANSYFPGYNTSIRLLSYCGRRTINGEGQRDFLSTCSRVLIEISNNQVIIC